MSASPPIPQGRIRAWLRRLARVRAMDAPRLRTALRKEQIARSRLLNRLASMREARQRDAVRLGRYRAVAHELRDKLAQGRRQVRALESQTRKTAKKAQRYVGRIRQLQASAGQRQELQAALETLRGERDELATQLAETRRTGQEQQERTLAELQAAQEALAARSREMTELAATESQLREEVTRLEGMLERTGQALLAAEQERSRTAAELAATQQAIAARDQEIAEMIDTQDRLRAQIGRLNWRLNGERAAWLDAERQRVQTAAELAQAQQGIAARDYQIGELLRMEDQLRHEAESLQRMVDAGRDTLSEVELQRARIAADLATAQHGIQTREGVIAELTAARDRLQLAQEALERALAEARMQVTQISHALLIERRRIKAVHALASSEAWDGTLSAILDAASEAVPFERGTLAVLDVPLGLLTVQAARNSPVATDQMLRLGPGEGVAGWALQHGESLLVSDSRSDPRFKPGDPNHGPRSLLAIPLLPDDGVSGVLTLARAVEDPFREEDLQDLGAFRADLERALANARHLDVLRDRSAALSKLLDASKALLSATNSQQLIALMLEMACEIGNGTAALLALQNPNTFIVEPAGAVGLPLALMESQLGWGAPVATEVTRSGQPWVTPLRDIMPPALAELAEASGCRMLVSVPCRTARREFEVRDALLVRHPDPAQLDLHADVCGVLHVYRSQQEPCPPAKVEPLQIFADHAAAILKAVRQSEQARVELRNASSLNVHLLGRERYIENLNLKIHQLEEALSE